MSIDVLITFVHIGTFIVVPIIFMLNKVLAEAKETITKKEFVTPVLYLVPYAIGLFLLWIATTVVMMPYVGMDGTPFELSIASGVLSLIMIAVTGLALSLAHYLIWNDLTDVYWNLEKWAFKVMLKRLVRKRYAPYVASLVDTLVDRELLSHNYDIIFSFNSHVALPKNHPTFGKEVAEFVQLLVDNLEDTDKSVIINNACISGERINQMAFLMTIIEDEEKYEVLTEVYNAEYADHINVFRRIVADIKKEHHAISSVKERTDLSAKQLRKLEIQQEIAALKKSSDSLRLTTN